MVCQGGTWKAILSANASGQVTKVGNQTCTTNEILKFDGTKFACAADSGSGSTTAAGNTGEVQFNSGGELGASSNYFWDNTNSHLGIGTSSPATLLDVSGEVKVGYTGLSCSSTTEGALRYSSASQAVEFCDGTSWTTFAQIQSTPGPTAPAGSGYFVLTESTWNGALGGLSGADAKCLTELSTTYTSWRGYSTANSNGQLTSGKVHAFLCNNSTCNNLMPLTTYYFAYANDGTRGGASFTTDSSGLGPGDYNAWSAANYFSGTYDYWTNRDWSDGQFWDPSGFNNNDQDCDEWVDGTSGARGDIGNSGYTDENRWDIAAPRRCTGSARRPGRCG